MTSSRNRVVREHVPVDAMFEEDRKIVESITVVGGILGGWIGGVQDYTYVKMQRGELGVSGEAKKGWTPDDFIAIDAPKPPLETFAPKASRCVLC